ncbi:hypothetical protein HDU76_003969, partial [Blyttiomyces sp. JEL0837]
FKLTLKPDAVMSVCNFFHKKTAKFRDDVESVVWKWDLERREKQLQKRKMDLLLESVDEETGGLLLLAMSVVKANRKRTAG